MKYSHRNHNMNFILASRKTERKNRHIVLLIPLLLICVLLCTWFAIQLAGRRVEKERLQLLEILEQEKMVTDQESLAASKEIQSLQDFCRNATSVADILEEAPQVKEETLKALWDLGMGKITIVSLEYKKGHMTCAALAPDYHEASKYIQRLEDAEVFECLEYGGFQKQSDGYYFTLDCELKPGEAGRDNEAE